MGRMSEKMLMEQLQQEEDIFATANYGFDFEVWYAMPNTKWWDYVYDGTTDRGTLYQRYIEKGLVTKEGKANLDELRKRYYYYKHITEELRRDFSELITELILMKPELATLLSHRLFSVYVDRLLKTDSAGFLVFGVYTFKQILEETDPTLSKVAEPFLDAFSFFGLARNRNYRIGDLPQEDQGFFYRRDLPQAVRLHDKYVEAKQESIFLFEVIDKVTRGEALPVAEKIPVTKKKPGAKPLKSGTQDFIDQHIKNFLSSDESKKRRYWHTGEVLGGAIVVSQLADYIADLMGANQKLKDKDLPDKKTIENRIKSSDLIKDKLPSRIKKLKRKK